MTLLKPVLDMHGVSLILIEFACSNTGSSNVFSIFAILQQANRVGCPLQEALALVTDGLRGLGIRNEVHIFCFQKSLLCEF